MVCASREFKECLPGGLWVFCECKSVWFVGLLTACNGDLMRRQLHQVDGARGIWWAPVHRHVSILGDVSAARQKMTRFTLLR